MQNNSEIERPPKPIWGTEITMPSELNELNEYDFSIVESQDVSDPTTSLLTPTEEYLHMTKRLIEKGTLSPRTSMILKELYTIYELNDGYGLATFDSKYVYVKPDKLDIRKDSIEIIKPPIKKKKRKEIVKEEEYVSRESSVSRRSTIITLEEEPLFGLHVVKDTTFERPCDPEAIKINNIFSDFSLIDTGHDKCIKRRITQWIKENFNKKEEQGTSEQKKSLWKIVRLNEEHYFIEILDDSHFCFLFLDIKKKIIK